MLLRLDDYIEVGWDELARSLKDLPQAAADPKLGNRDRDLVYVSTHENQAQVLDSWASVMSTHDRERLELRVLPTDIKERPQLGGGLDAQGLLYLPHSYVVPGGRFNEMYGWDSYFINLGLLASARLAQAQAMVDNHLYQVKHYGKVLNANRTYYLTRSQPPFLASMVADVWQRTRDLAWLRSVQPELVAYYRFWTQPPHFTPETGLSRYFDLGVGPAEEVEVSEQDAAGRTHYERIQEEFERLSLLRSAESEERLGYPLDLYYDIGKKEFTPLFYQGDRSMRESGFDPSDRFGRFNLDVTFYNPVDLNSLLYLYEHQMAVFAHALEEEASAKAWLDRAQKRKSAMQQTLWDESTGLFLDYNFKTAKRRYYPFATTFFPLWTGWATPRQAKRVHKHLKEFLKPGGLVTSFKTTANQWDAPFGWAPLQLIAVQGLDAYGFTLLATKIAAAFVGMLTADFKRTGTLLEKYDVLRCTSDVSSEIAYGYSSNEIGFGWTNAVYLLLKERLGR